MADNIAITAGSGTTVHADEYTHGTYGAGKSQVIKVTWGPAGTGNDVDTASGKPLPAQIRGSDGTDLFATAPAASSTGALKVVVASDQMQATVAHDAAAASIDPNLIGGYGSAAAPSNVSATNDAVRAWFLLNGAQAIALTAAGALIGGDATNGIDVDITRTATQGYSSAATFTPAAASHVAGDCNGAAQEFATSGPSGQSILITSATLYIDNTSAEATAWRLHLYNVTPTSAIADDAAWDFADADVTQYLGFVDLPSTATDTGTNQWVEVNGINKQVKLSGTSLFGYLVNLTTLTPAAAAHKVTLHTIAV